MNMVIKPLPFTLEYAASNTGFIFSLKRGRIHQLSPHNETVSNTRYRVKRLTVSLYINGKSKTHKVHHLVMATFGVQRPAPDALIRHLDGDHTNNDINNLIWGGHLHNIMDRERHNVSKEQLIEDLSFLSLDDVSEIYGLSKKIILSKIV